MARESAPDTIVLVHGLWMTPRSWEEWVPYYESQGLQGRHADLPRLRGRGRGAAGESRRRSPPQPCPATVDHIAEAIAELDTPPIIMGHSFGGTLTQLLLDRGSAPPASSSTPRRPRASA